MVLAKILIEEGTEVKVGSIVCISVDDVADVEAFANYKLDDSAAAEPAAPKKTE